MIEATAERRGAGVNVYYGWVVLGVAALAMVGTLPGRTQGLGLITEPLLVDLGVDRVRFAQINLVATLAGSLMCFGIGGLVDRRGSRIVLTVLALLLGGVVVALASVGSAAMLLVLITLTRGLGQSALSVVSLAMPGKWFRRRLTWAMGVYALVTSVGFMLAFPAVGALVLSRGWRVAWVAVGAALIFGLAPLAWLFVRPEPESNFELEALGGARAGRSSDRTDAHARRRASIAGLLGLRHRELAVRARRVGHRAVQRIDPGRARLFAGRVLHRAGRHGDYRPGRQLRRWRVGRSHVAQEGADCRAAPDGGRARRAASRDHDRARDGPGGGDGRRRRLRDGRVLQLLGESVRTHAPGTDPGRGPGADRLRVGRRTAAAGGWAETTGSYAGAFYALAATLGLLAVAAMIVPVPAGAVRA